MPPWGGKDPTLGNNPLVMAVPRNNGEHVVLDMAVSQYSYGALHEHKLKNKKLAAPGGYDENGKLTDDPSAISHSRRVLPVGFWKGSGLSLVIDVLLNSLTGGRTTKQVTDDVKEKGVTQLFLCIYQQPLHDHLADEIIAYTKSSQPVEAGGKISYPGQNLLHGMPVNEKNMEGSAADVRMSLTIQCGRFTFVSLLAKTLAGRRHKNVPNGPGHFIVI